MKIIYSFNKTGIEARHWEKAIRQAGNAEFEFLPFNHGQYLDPAQYLDAWSLDRLYQRREPGLMGLYEALQRVIRESRTEAMIVFHCPPYHPEFLRKLPIYKALYSGDDPDSTYKRNIPYLHAYDHVFFVDPAYSPDLDMREKMQYCGMKNADWIPYGVLDYSFDPSRSEEQVLNSPRDIDILYVGSFFRQKLDVLGRVSRALGRRFQLHGFFRFKHNLYFNMRCGVMRWVRPVSFEQRVRLLQRTRIGFNIHWSEYGLGNERLYYLPANGVMQICDCADHLHLVYDVGKEVMAYRGSDDLIDKLRYYLDHEPQRQQIAQAGYRRVMRDYRFATVTRLAAQAIRRGMSEC